VKHRNRIYKALDLKGHVMQFKKLAAEVGAKAGPNAKERD
jgi:hypothetical protein